jgi:maltose alpha-D-glucosyltransferase/alpha-amylase
VPSPGPRPGWYLKNFYDAQPALNFGWAQRPADEPWRDAVDAPGPLRNRQALKDILDFWLRRGIAGFRVDMAFSLVKDDPGKAETVALWRELRAWLDANHPDAVLIPEGREPRTGGPLAFHADFFLVIHAAHASLFDNGYAGTLPGSRSSRRTSTRRAGAAPRCSATRGRRPSHPTRRGPVLLSTADHDYDRLRCGPRGPEQLGAALTFLFTWGSVPCLYYGDEIGMRLPARDARRRGRRAATPPTTGRAAAPRCSGTTGRTRASRPADPDRLYLPVDPEPDRPTVAAQHADPSSTLHLVPRADRPPEGHTRARRPGRHRGGVRGLPARLRAGRVAPRRRQPAGGAGGRRGAGRRGRRRAVRPGRHHRGK